MSYWKLTLSDSPQDTFPQLLDVPNLWEDILIIWDGWMAVVVQSLQTGIVYKLPHEDSEEAIEAEFSNHEAFLFVLREWRQEGKIPKYVKIPSIRHIPSEHNWVFAQEKVDWLTLKSIELLRTYPWIPDEVRKEMLLSATDYDVKEYFVNELQFDSDNYDFSFNCPAVDVLSELVPAEKYAGFLSALDYFESKWCRHADLHNSNVMIDKEWNIFIIDFWRVEKN